MPGIAQPGARGISAGDLCRASRSFPEYCGVLGCAVSMHRASIESYDSIEAWIDVRTAA